MNWTEEDKAWLTGLFQGVEKRVIAVEAKLQEAEARSSERLHDLETKLLTEFHNWTSPQEARLRTHTAALRAI